MDKGSVENYVTYGEIVRQQSSWRNALNSFSSRRADILKLIEPFRKRTWVFSGCGTSFYLAQTASFLFKAITGIATNVTPASEILINSKNVFNNPTEYLLIVISRSGKTTEIVKAAELARNQLNIPTLAVSCNPNSDMVVKSNLKLTFPFSQEESVVMTGSFTTMLLSITYLASLISSNSEIETNLWKIAEFSATLMKEYEPLIQYIGNEKDLLYFIFLGQGSYFGIANEAALKMQEMSLSFSQAYHSLEYRHGPMSTAEANTLITLLLSHSVEDYEITLLKDLRKLGAKLLVFSSKSNSQIIELTDYYVKVPDIYHDYLNHFLYMPLLQLLGYYKSLAKNINPDKPKNLSAVVTLEL